MELALLFQRRLAGALLGEFLLHHQFGRSGRRVLHRGAAVELAHAQREQFRR